MVRNDADLMRKIIKKSGSPHSGFNSSLFAAGGAIDTLNCTPRKPFGHCTVIADCVHRAQKAWQWP
jgi:hypothetical protein